VDTLNVILAGIGLAPLPFERARAMIGGGARLLINSGLAAAGNSLPPGEVDGLVSLFIAHYGEHIADRSRPFPGLENALDALASRGSRFAVCTNKLEWLARRLLDRVGLTQRFVAICGADSFGVQKPDPEILRKTVAQAGGILRRAVMVGDSARDIETAQAAGIPVIAVDYGYTDVPIAELDPDRVISDLQKLPGAVFELLTPSINVAQS
jgi:phosphoglycolate phosphatase